MLNTENAEKNLQAKKVEAPVKKLETSPSKADVLEDRLYKLSILFDLQKKHSRLQESKANLESFVIDYNKENSTLKISDDDRNEFKTSNPLVIAEVIKIMKETIVMKTAEVAAQIVF